MDWSLLGCGRGGHITYAPDEPDLRRQMSASTAAAVAAGAGAGEGAAWQCLRCGAFVPGPPDGSGPAAAAPSVRRGKEVRSALILRIFAIERFLRALVFGVAAYGVWRFSRDRSSLQRAFNHDMPDVRRLYEDLGFSFQHSKLIGLVQHALRLNSRTLGYLAIGLAAYAVIEIIEGTGLWLLRRWGEYFAMVATSVFLPYEIYDLSSKVTALRAAAFAVNLALVIYLVVTKRLFGVRGGRRAYEERLREGSIIEQAAEAAAAEKAEAAPGEAGPGEAGPGEAGPGEAGPGEAGPGEA
ncbi:MAG TPA: DUF2127 domain-containing protein, partial [Streptosporangiaceae bacterium]|nr:DUF2127 domain-containing protein [Streptosporangiaceae bacterium]